MLVTIVKFTPAHAKLRLANLPSFQHLQRVDTAARSLLNVDRVPRYFIRHKLLYSTIRSGSHATSSSVSAPRPQQLVPSSILDRSQTTYFAPQDRITRTAALEGTTKNTTQGVPPSSGGSHAAAGTKRRASSELLSLENRTPKARIEPISYGTSVFFARTKSTLAPTSASQGTSPLASQEGTPDSSHEPEPRSMVIRLTEQEDKICSVLDEVAKRYEEKQGKKVQLRIAGGWVRDKLLGLSCHDLDVGLDTMMGYEFAVLVNEYMESLGHGKRTIAKIATNPEKSKHLETATMVVLGMPLDFVNLRSEVYDEGSRIPSEITFGTPSEDAFRRDITINALFYNIHTRTVEDFTGKGLEDLKNGYIRTPLEPFETFWQDPLRVMRCIRFAARFQFNIAEEAKQAILDPRIKQVLKTKISKERIGAELDKMIDDGAGRSTALGLIQELGLYDVVFAPPEINDVAKGTTRVQGESRSTEEAFKLVWIMEWLLKINHSSAGEEYDSIVYQGQIDEGQEKMLRQTQGLPWTNHLYPAIKTDIAPEIPHIPQMTAKEEPFPEKLGKRNLILAGMLYPYRDMSATVNKKIVPAGSWILRYGLKGRNLDIEIVTKLTESIKNVQEVVDKTTLTIPEDEEALREERASMGVVIRDIGFITVVGKKWPCAFLLALGVDLIPKFDQLKRGVMDEDVRAKIEKYNTFLRKAETYDIDHCFSWKYIVDGKELTQLLKIRPGPKITEYLQVVMRWQLRYPQSSKEACQDWILKNSHLFQ
ncbi:hypothetical protein BG006_001844 [Podila minutissima]|uniref:tRNA nucleotidyltransferase n=1 Tax=Podila minutissima TaxID=64525 RepID=A0A9P5VNL6_9FUNG|nr:hypothetical protein BG006_001844 [Podila minutissima]